MGDQAPEGSKQIFGSPGRVLRKAKFEQILEDDKQALGGPVSGAGDGGSGSEGLLAGVEYRQIPKGCGQITLPRVQDQGQGWLARAESSTLPSTRSQ